MDNVVTFLKLQDWSIPPEKEIITKEEPSANNIRWMHNSRVKGSCWPYKIAKEIGWVIKSPIDVEIEPVSELQVRCNSNELEEIQQYSGIDFWVKREEAYIGVKPDGWFRIHQAKVDDVWQPMFIPNGERSFEWKLGWGIEIPEDFVLLFQPLEYVSDFIVHPGVIPSKRLSAFNQVGLGMPIAFEPLRKAKINKGDPIAKLLVVHKSILNLKCEVREIGELIES